MNFRFNCTTVRISSTLTDMILLITGVRLPLTVNMHTCSFNSFCFCVIAVCTFSFLATVCDTGSTENCFPFAHRMFACGRDGFCLSAEFFLTNRTIGYKVI